VILVLLCCAYILGIWVPFPWGNVGLFVALTGAAWTRSPYWYFPVPRGWRYGPTARWWMVAALVSGFAAFYFWLQIPTPGPNDVSRLLSPDQASLPVQVTGIIERRPALTRRRSVQLWLAVKQVQQPPAPPESVTGNLYVTIPRKAAKRLLPTQTITVTGQLYRPSPVTRPHGFDFATFLAREGAFAGLKGTQVQIKVPGTNWGGWAIRQRIVDALVQGTDARTGALISALVLGKEAADIDYGTKDNFIRLGLAHALSASGFQVSLILTAILTLGRSLPPPRQATIGFIALLAYGFLSGADPSIVRAILMGCASLAALWLQRQTRPVELLLAVATLMLLWNPLWAFDLGFLLSMLATLGLIVTVPPLMQHLDWLPPTIGSLLAVPFAATIWTLPLQLHTFGILPLYSLLANVVVALLLSALTIGGVVSAVAALLWPMLGSLLAGLLFWPTQLLLAIISGISQLPGHTLALGTISLWQLIGLYGCIGAVWRWGQRRWRLMAAISLLILVVPLWQVQTQRFLVTVFDQTRTPIMVIEHPRGTVLLNTDNAEMVQQSLVPFLQQEGINRIDWAINTEPSTKGWRALLHRLPIVTLGHSLAGTRLPAARPPLPKHQIYIQPQSPLSLDTLQAMLWRVRPTILELQVGAQHWLLVDGTDETDFAAWLTTVQLPPIQVLWWTGSNLSSALVAQLHPQVLLCSGRRMTEETITALKEVVPSLFWTERDGTVQWTPQQGFQVTVNPGENTTLPF
jgi:competence protein ComEC